MSIKSSVAVSIVSLVVLSGGIVAMIRPSQLNGNRTSSWPVKPQSNAGSKDPSGHRTAKGLETQAMNAPQLDQEEFQRDRAFIESFVYAEDLDGMVKAADDIDRKWGQTGGEYYGQLMLNTANLIINHFHDEKTAALSQKYIFDALARADTFSLELETKLLPFLSIDLNPTEKTNGLDSAWARERSDKTKLWLHAWQRMEKEIDRNFNFNDRAFLNVSPPDKTGLPAGVSPEAVKDPALRAQYEAAISANAEKARKYNRQHALRYIDETFSKNAEQYLIRAYSTPPFNTEELTKYLNAYIPDKRVQGRILHAVAKNTSAL